MEEAMFRDLIKKILMSDEFRDFLKDLLKDLLTEMVEDEDDEL